MEKNSPLLNHLIRFLEGRACNSPSDTKLPPLVLYVVSANILKATDETRVWSMDLPSLQNIVGHQITGDPTMYRIDLQEWNFAIKENPETQQRTIDIICAAPRLLRMLKKPKSTLVSAKALLQNKEVQDLLAATQDRKETTTIVPKPTEKLGPIGASRSSVGITNPKDSRWNGMVAEKGKKHPRSKDRCNPDWEGSIDVLFGVLPPKELLDIDRTNALLHTRARMSVFYSTSVEKSGLDSRSRSRSKSRGMQKRDWSEEGDADWEAEQSECSGAEMQEEPLPMGPIATAGGSVKPGYKGGKFQSESPGRPRKLKAVWAPVPSLETGGVAGIFADPALN